MKNILLLTDFSKNSKNAIDYALQLFKNEVCNFFILHVHDSMSYTTDDLMTVGNDSIYEAIIKEHKLKLKKLIDRLEPKSKNHNFHTLVAYNTIIDAVKKAIKSKNIDLIVMGTNGVTGAKEIIFGSNTINVIRKVNCKTLVIPQGFKFKTLKEVLLPLDLYDSMSGITFEKVLLFIKKFMCKIHILRINPRNEKSEFANTDNKQILNFSKDIIYKYHIINSVPMHYVINCYTQIYNTDLTILLVQHESFFEWFFKKSTTSQISNAIRTPLLIFHS